MKKVLVIDDSLISRAVVKRALQPSGYEVLEAINGEDALKILSDVEVHLVILDLAMPVLNGLELLSLVKNNLAYQKNKFTPFIALTAIAREDIKQQALKNGVQAYLVKPVDPQKILETVQKLLP